jgi:hypothetical protein
MDLWTSLSAVYLTTLSVAQTIQRRYFSWNVTGIYHSYPGQSMWDLWWTEWHRDSFLYEPFGFLLSVSFHRGCPCSYIKGGMNNKSVGGRSPETSSLPIDMSNSNYSYRLYMLTTACHMPRPTYNQLQIWSNISLSGPFHVYRRLARVCMFPAGCNTARHNLHENRNWELVITLFNVSVICWLNLLCIPVSLFHTCVRVSRLHTGWCWCWNLALKHFYAFSCRYNQGYCDETRRNAVPDAFPQNDESWNSVLEPFFPGIGFTRLVVSCYPTALFSNKFAYFARLLKQNLLPLRSTEFCVTMRSEPFSLKKK